MKGRLLACGLGAVILLAFTLNAAAQEKAAGTAPPPDSAMAAMMAEWAKWANPGDAHKNLERFVGNWTTLTKAWMDPAASPVESKGTMKAETVLGGRWLRCDYHSPDFMGMQFNGISYTGYDLFRTNYVATWVDDWSTSLMHLTGTLNETGTEYVFTGKIDDALAGVRDKPFREVIRWTGPDEFVLEMYDIRPDTGEFLGMSVTHTRVK